MIVKNDRDEEVYTQILRPTKPQLFNETFEDEIDNCNFKKNKINEVENIKTY